mgnify:CR=1 FL=1
MGAVVDEFLYLFEVRHAPGSTHVDCCSIIARTCNVRADVGVIVIPIIISIAISVCLIIVHALLACLAPGIVAAVVFGGARAYVAAAPLRAARQSEVNGMGMMVVRTGKISCATCFGHCHLTFGLHLAAVRGRASNGAGTFGDGCYKTFIANRSYSFVAARPCDFLV